MMTPGKIMTPVFRVEKATFFSSLTTIESDGFSDVCVLGFEKIQGLFLGFLNLRNLILL